MQNLKVLETSIAPSTLRDRRTAAGIVTESLREAISSGKLPDGTELNQVALAEHFGVSRVPVREALRALEAEGWISALPHRRAVVLAQSRDRICEILELRALIERHLLAKAIHRIDAEGIARLCMLCDAMDAQSNHGLWVELNREYHAAMLEPANSPVALELVEQLSAQVGRYVQARHVAVAREGKAGREHRAIVKAIAARDEARALELLARHIDGTQQLIIETEDI